MSSNVTILVFYERGNLGIRDRHLIKLMVNDWKVYISLLSCEASLFTVIFIFPSFFFVFFFFFIFKADTSLVLFTLKGLIRHGVLSYFDHRQNYL